MAKITWDKTGEHFYEVGVDRGVLYPMKSDGSGYDKGVAWNGLTGVSEKPSGAESSDQYADNVKYLSIRSAEKFDATIEAFTYPDEFGACDGTAELTTGVKVGQQTRKAFGLSYRTMLGNDTQGNDHGYLIHLIYGASAAPSEKGYSTVNDSIEPIKFSWEISTVPVPVEGKKPTSTLVINSTKAKNIKNLEDYLYGTDAGSGVSSGATGDPQLPLPDKVKTLLQ